MLIFTRFEGDRAIVDDIIRVTIVEVQGGRVRLGFEAPKNVVIHRENVWEKVNGRLWTPTHG